MAAVLGVVIGLILAFSGAGGGILAIPLLVLVLHLPLQQAGPVGLAAVGIASAVGAVVGLRAGVVRYRAAVLMGAVGMLSAPFGVTLAQHLPNRPLMAGFALVMVWVAWRMVRPESTAMATGARDLPCHVNPARGRLIWSAPCAQALAGTGAVSGLLSGLIGVGGGFVIVPALTRQTDLDIRSVQATSLAVIALVSVSGVVAAGFHGALNWAVAWPFALGATVALLLGQRLARGLDAARLKQAFALVCVVVAGMMLWRAAGHA